MARILVVDDDPDVLRIVERVLKMAGHDVFTAHDAMKAMDMLNASLYDLLISDANMPRFSGFELIRTIKNNKKFMRMAVIMLTGLREKKDIEKAIRVGVDDYIVKPIEPAIIADKVESMLSRKPPMEKAVYEIAENTSYARGEVTAQVRVTQLNETGLVLRSNIEILEGINVTVHSDLFKRMDLQVPPMKVLQCRKLVEFDYEIKVGFVGVNENFYQKIRTWIFANQKNKKVAA